MTRAGKIPALGHLLQRCGGRRRGPANAPGSLADQYRLGSSRPESSPHRWPHVTGRKRTALPGDLEGGPSNRVVPRRPPSSLGRGRLEYFWEGMAMKPSGVIWFNGEIVPWGAARGHVVAHAPHYGRR